MARGTAKPLAKSCGWMDAGVATAATAFQARWGRPAEAVVAAPGRVNVIGEHVDHQGYGVLPMALQGRACFVAVGAAVADGDAIAIANCRPADYPSGTFSARQLLQGPMQLEQHSWHSYVLAAVSDVLRHTQRLPPHGLQLMVHCSVPPGAGLSSSSALVVASMVACLALWRVPMGRFDIAALAARCERHVGTQGGGMDQAISLLAQPGFAMKVDFDPVRAVPVQLPGAAAFVVAHSLSSSFKADTAASRFNRRVLECRLAAMLLAKQLDPGSDAWRTTTTLHQVQGLLLQRRGHRAPAGGPSPQQCAGPAGCTDPSLVAEVRAAWLAELLPLQAYSVTELEQRLGEPLRQLLRASPAALKVLDAEEAAAAAAAPAAAAAAAGHGGGDAGGGFKLQQRARHVFTEAARVLEFQAVCGSAPRGPPGSDDPGEALTRLGALMSASHASCRDDFECSCRELDRLVELAAAGGALGARLTGAGWGGCMVALVPQRQLDAFQQHLVAHYYAPAVQAGALPSLDPVLGGQHLFATAPGAGAAVRLLSSQPGGAAAPWDLVGGVDVAAGQGSH